MKRRSMLFALAGVMSLPLAAYAQGGGGGGQGQRRMATSGTVTEVATDALTVQPRRMGRPGGNQQPPAPVKFTTNDKTLYAEIKVGQAADIKTQQWAVVAADNNDKPTATGVAVYTTVGDQADAGRVLRAAAMQLMMRAMMANAPGVAGQAQIGVPQQAGGGGGNRPRPNFLRGQITAVGGGTLTIKTADKEVVVTLPDKAVVLTAAAIKRDEITKDNTVAVTEPEGAQGDAKVADAVVKMPPMARPAGGAGAGGGARGNRG
ncbi:MAG: hypothetical protein HZB16_05080 [Armatimonadetes bacterium]|nr:hypothetical protein [Armatimonadota bacterium]